MQSSPQAGKIALSSLADADESATQVNQALTFPDKASFDVAVGDSINNHIKANHHENDADNVPTDVTGDADEPNLLAIFAERNIPLLTLTGRFQPQ